MNERFSSVQQKIRNLKTKANQNQSSFFKTPEQLEKEAELASLRQDRAGATLELVAQIDALIKGLEKKIEIEKSGIRKRRDKFKETIDQLYENRIQLSTIENNLVERKEKLQKVEEELQVVEKTLEDLNIEKKLIYAAINEGLTEKTRQEKLITAVQSNNILKVQEAINEGASIDTRNAQGQTALHCAVMMQYQNLVAFLIQKKADVNARTQIGGYTPLHLIVDGCVKTAALLLDAGADPFLKDDDGFLVNEATMDLDIIALIEKKQATISTKTQSVKINAAAITNTAANKQFIDAAQNNDISKAQEALNEGAFIDTRNAQGQTALHCAVMMQYQNLVEFLIQKRADVNARTQEGGYTPLHLIVDGCVKIAALLLDAGADPFLKDDEGFLVNEATMDSDIIALIEQKQADSSPTKMI